MFAYTIKRILQGIPTLLIASVLIFSIIHIAPGDPAELIAGEFAPPAQVEQIRESMGFNRPIHIQYIGWISRAIRGDMGNSVLTYTPVLEMIAYRAETSAFLAFFSMLLVTFFGISIGVISAAKYNSFIDQFFMSVAMFGAAVPAFWTGLVFIVFFSVYLGWFPTSGFPSLIESGDFHNLKYLVLPCIALAIPRAALIIRLTRASMLDVFKEDYVKTARTKGLSEFKVVMKHIFRNSLLSVVPALGFTLVSLASSTAVIENVFALPGIGHLIVQSIRRRDYPVIQGIILVVVVLYTIVNLLVDISYAYLDPRIRYK